MQDLGLRYMSPAQAEAEMNARASQPAPADDARLTALETRMTSIEQKLDALLAERKKR